MRKYALCLTANADLLMDVLNDSFPDEQTHAPALIVPTRDRIHHFFSCNNAILNPLVILCSALQQQFLQAQADPSVHENFMRSKKDSLSQNEQNSFLFWLLPRLLFSLLSNRMNSSILIKHILFWFNFINLIYVFVVMHFYIICFFHKNTTAYQGQDKQNNILIFNYIIQKQFYMSQYCALFGTVCTSFSFVFFQGQKSVHALQGTWK